MAIGYDVTDNLPGFMPKDAETMRCISFSVKEHLDQRSSRVDSFVCLLKRLMPSDSISIVRYPEDQVSGTRETGVMCWLSEAELELVSELTGCVDTEEETGKVLLEAIEILEEATDDGVDQDR
jgi:hypothetical protein